MLKRITTMHINGLASAVPLLLLVLLTAVALPQQASGFGLPVFSSTTTAAAKTTTSAKTVVVVVVVTEDDLKNPFAEPKDGRTVYETRDVVNKVAVAGATGKLGRYVVEELLARGVSVVAVVRDLEKAKTAFPDAKEKSLNIVHCNLGDADQVTQVLSDDADIDTAIWCATGFVDAPPKEKENAAVEKFKSLFRTKTAAAPSQTIDEVGLPAIAQALQKKKQNNNKKDNSNDNMPAFPKIVMCSSSGVTRTIWSEDKKKKFAGAAEIPIVRLNPFSILDRKRESEDELRAMVGIDYCIVRPCGLNDDNWPPNSRPLFSQGDVAVGRIHRRDVASILVNVLSCPEATGKTFEAITLAGYPAPSNIGPALSRLQKDSERKDDDDEASLFATYAALQQLLPGEKQDAAALAMGQTYEQLDTGTTGRLGERGTEDAEAALRNDGNAVAAKQGK